jgi:hypothetical protein
LGGACRENDLDPKVLENVRAKSISRRAFPTYEPSIGCKLTPREAAGGFHAKPDFDHLLWTVEHSDIIIKDPKLIIRIRLDPGAHTTQTISIDHADNPETIIL